ncbi:MAG TPA: sulfate adenylyltransferase, partial [Acidimicrobiia bacterium]
SDNTPWYDGPTLLHHLEHVYIGSDRNLIDPRFPVQLVIRPMSHEHHDYRGYAGVVAGGIFRPGDEVVVLPSGFTTTIEAIDRFGEPIDEAFPPSSVTIRLRDQIDISRGDMLCRTNNQPAVTQDIDAQVCWFSPDRALEADKVFAIKHTTRWARAKVTDLRYRLDVNTLSRDEGCQQLRLNDIGRVRLRTTQPLFVDEYRRNQSTGSFILVDEGTNETLGAGMIISSD